MKLASIGPFTASPAAELDRHEEAEAIKKRASLSEPVQGTGANLSTTEDNLARQGILRLADFIKKQKPSSPHLKLKRPLSLVRKQIQLYEALDMTEWTLATHGQGYDKIY